MALITQEALAERLDVSVATVSRALRHDASVHPRTRARILKMAAEAGYEPVDDGRSKRRTPEAARGHVTVIIPSQAPDLDAVHWPHAGVLTGMSRAAQGASFRLTVLAQTDATLATVPDDATAVALFVALPAAQVAELAAAYPVASLVFDYPGIDRIDVVGADDFRALGELVDHLVAAGHRRIGFITYAGKQNWEMERLGAYAAALWRHGLHPEPERIVALRSLDQPLSADREAWQRAHDAGVTAWVCANDLLAYTFIARLREDGIDVPGEVSVAGFDGVEPLPGLPRLMTLRPPLEAIGYNLLRCLRSRTHNPTQPGRRVLFRCALVKGETVGPAAAVGSVAAVGPTAAETTQQGGQNDETVT